MKTKVSFTLNMGFFTAEQEEEYTLEELGVNSLDENIEDKLEEIWFEWASKRINGGWKFIENEGET